MRIPVDRAVFKLLKGIFFLVPRPLCLTLGRSAGSFLFIFDRRHRRVALRNLETALGADLSAAERKKIARASFRNFGALTADILKLFHLSDRRIAGLLRVEGEENLARALRQGRGVIIVTGHLGNWEIAARAVSRLGRLHVIARRLDSSALEKELLSLRRRLGGDVIYKKEAAKRVLQALRDGEMVAILIDQNVLRREGVFVDFFGRPASTTPAAAAFHLRTGAPIVPVFCRPAPGGTYELVIHPALESPRGGTLEENVLKTTAICTKMIETEIRRTPGFWLWFHDRWRTRPLDEHENRPET